MLNFVFYSVPIFVSASTKLYLKGNDEEKWLLTAMSMIVLNALVFMLTHTCVCVRACAYVHIYIAYLCLNR